ncbi:MAG: lamin tail domain-containing protein, partial [bacterium]
QQSMINQTFSGEQSFEAVFTPNSAQEILVINEINYNSADYHDPADWIELHNPHSSSVNLTGWICSDDSINNGFVIPEGTVMEPGGFFVLVRDSVQFHTIFPECIYYTGPLGFGLSGAGETIRLWNPHGVLVDSVTYDDTPPWPAQPDGNGPTLELIDYTNDNSDPENWQASDYFGSPGAGNGQEKNFLSALCDSVIITEINYHSAPETDAGDWCELYNRSSQTIELFRWKFCDENGNTYELPVSFPLASHAYVVLAEDSVLFQTVFPEVFNFTGNLGFGLNNAGEFLCVKDSTGLFVDSLKYDDQPPWPSEPDGNGPTLELIDLSADNSYPANWQASAGTGTPGRSRDQDTTGTRENTNGRRALTYALLPSYPNPFNPDTHIPYTIPNTSKITVQIYDVLGRVVRTWEEKQPPGTHLIYWDGRDEQKQYLSAGVYIVHFRTEQFQAQRKLILLK